MHSNHNELAPFANSEFTFAFNLRTDRRPRLPKDLRELIRQMAGHNISWGQDRIANELQLKLGIRVSPRTVGKYLRNAQPARTPDPQQRWLTFVHNHAQGSWRAISSSRLRHVPHPLCVRDYGTGNPPNSPPERDHPSNRGVDTTTTARGCDSRKLRCD